MARQRWPMPDLLSDLAKSFRMGQLGAAEPGTAAPARAEIQSVAQIIAELQARHQLPTPAQGMQQAWSYVCYWFDVSTGDRIGRGVRHVITAPYGSSYQAVSAEARRRTLRPSPTTASPPPPVGANYRLRCSRVGSIIDIPTS